MRLTVTPLGAAGTAADVVARRIVGYLEGREPSPARQLLGPPDATAGAPGAARYFSDSMEGSGRWLGRGAAEMNLVGDVDPQHFERVLSGRHPVTGERLVSARGSAGRRHVAVGTAALVDEHGEVHYDLRDVAAITGLSISDIEAMAARGEEAANHDHALADWLGTSIGPRGERLVPAREVERWLALTDLGVSGTAVLAAGAATEWLTTKQASLLTGISPRYLRRLCQRYIERPERNGSRRPGQEWLECERVAVGTGVGYRIRRSDLAVFADRRRAPAVRCGFDLTLTTEKSFAVLMMLADPDRQSTLERALDAANDVAFDYLETHAAFTRHKGQRVAATGLIVASYLHGTSRALDPFPHRHNIVANTALDANGERKTLDARALYQHAPVAAALATAEMRWRLSTELGVTWRRSARGVWEIDGVPDDVLDEFSQRRDAIEAAVGELERVLGRPVTKNEVQRAVLDTRGAKQATTVAELLADWHERAARHGFGRDALDRCFGQADRLQSKDPALRAAMVDHLVGPEGLCANVNLFDRGDVIRALIDTDIRSVDGRLQPLIAPPAQIEALATDILNDERVVELRLDQSTLGVGHRGCGEVMFTTLELLECQERIRTRFADGLHANRAVVPEDVVAAAIEGSSLDHDQGTFVHEMCTSGAHAQAAIGPPGSGKTAAMAIAARAWEQAGFNVVGAAVKGEAARLLGKHAGIATNTLAWYLAHDDVDRRPFDERTVVIVDEASTIADRDLDRLLALAAATGCVLRLVGDPAQHGAVGAGGSFASLTRMHADNTPALSGNRRLLSPPERRVADLVRDGHISDALAMMATTGQIIEADTDLEAQITTIDRWWTYRQSGDAHPMVDRLNANRRILNTLAHELRVAAGEVSDAGLVTHAGTEFGVGDEVIAKKPFRHLHAAGDPSRYVRNGSLGTVAAITGAGLSIAFEDIGTIEVPLPDIEGPGHRVGIDHAYAVTSYAVQGSTFERSTSVITPDSSRAELYVDITRGRQQNVVITVNPRLDQGDETHLPRLPAPPLVNAVADGVARRKGEQSVLEMDPLALGAARLSRGRSLASLHAEFRRSVQPGSPGGFRSERSTLDRATKLAEGRVRRHALRDQPEGCEPLMGTRPAELLGGAEWDSAASALAVYEARWLRPWAQRPLGVQEAEHREVAAIIAKVREGRISNSPALTSRDATRETPRAPTTGAHWSGGHARTR